eukprot:TRINITY_DN177_c2_g1_i1.p1 TRINITY_DN177_c2_g1~~TRINITY_DN177_c2_g1_i1.p1  ORF type:complete len:121 (-),score=28.64 TRINITY_DN177_c2_g1_i1:82-390(-)
MRILALFLSIFIGVSFAKSKRTNSAINAAFRSAERHCLDGNCSFLGPEHAVPCVRQCVSGECYNEVYGTDPLEPGEIDTERGRLFKNCFTRVKKAENAAKKA